MKKNIHGVEVLNLEYNKCRLLLHALNTANSANDASRLLGYSERALYRWKAYFGIIKDETTGKYISTWEYTTDIQTLACNIKMAVITPAILLQKEQPTKEMREQNLKNKAAA